MPRSIAEVIKGPLPILPNYNIKYNNRVSAQLRVSAQHKIQKAKMELQLLVHSGIRHLEQIKTTVRHFEQIKINHTNLRIAIPGTV